MAALPAEGIQQHPLMLYLTVGRSRRLMAIQRIDFRLPVRPEPLAYLAADQTMGVLQLQSSGGKSNDPAACRSYCALSV